MAHSGRWLPPKWTGQHNTLLMDGQGQMGEGKMWFDGDEPLAHKARPTIALVESTDAFDHIQGDATNGT